MPPASTLSGVFCCVLLRFGSHLSDILDKIKFYFGVGNELLTLYHHINFDGLWGKCCSCFYRCCMFRPYQGLSFQWTHLHLWMCMAILGPLEFGNKSRH